jgi:hypothetical protein
LQPAERWRYNRRRLVAAYLAAIALPVVVAAALIPFRDDLAQTSALLLVVPVVVVATLGGVGPSLVAALAASVAFDVLLTRPFYDLAIHDSDDIVAAIVLLAVGASVGTIALSLARLRTRAATRLEVIDHLLAFAETSSDDIDTDSVLDEARWRLTALLGLQGSEWRAGGGTTDAPVLLPGGQLMGYLRDFPADRAQLTDGSELPVRKGDREFGRFVLHPQPGHIVSLEERRTAVAIANLVAGVLADAPTANNRP